MARLRAWQWTTLAVAAVLVLGGVAAALWLRQEAPPAKKAAEPEVQAPLLSTPSVAVLPFTYTGGEAALQLVAKGIAENLIAAFSKLSGMLVIARNSAFAYRGAPLSVKEVGEKLKVRFVLTGKIEPAGDQGEQQQLRDELLDTSTGQLRWAASYDLELKDLFAIQDQIRENVVAALALKPSEAENARVVRRATDNVDAWGFFIQGSGLLLQASESAIVQARELFQRAIEIDPRYALAWTMLARTFLFEATFGEREVSVQSIKTAQRLADKAMELDDSLGAAHTTLGMIHLLQQRYDQAIAEGEKAIALVPNSATELAFLAKASFWSGHWEKTIHLLTKAMRLHPKHPQRYFAYLGTSYRFTERPEEAIATYIRWFEGSKDNAAESALLPHIYLASLYGEIGWADVARTHVDHLHKIDPSFSLALVHKVLFFKYPGHLHRFLDGLRSAGLN